MIYLFFGENTYAKQQAVKNLITAAQKSSLMPSIERFDGEALDIGQLSIILQGASLFSSQKLVLIHGASKNKALWVALEKWIERIPEGTNIIFIESTPDRRTKTFKLLQKHAEVKEFANLSELEAIKWLLHEADRQSGVLTAKQAEQIVTRAGTDQWRLSNELRKLVAYGINEEAIESLVEPTPQANVFALLDAVLHKKQTEVKRLLATTRVTEDPYMLFGLMSAQLLQLAALIHSQKRSVEDIAKTLGVHPFPLKKLAPLARQTSPKELQSIIQAAAELDTRLKSTGLDPWLLLEQTFVKITTR